ncbi:MAG: diaminopimelate epimerase [bacterium]
MKLAKWQGLGNDYLIIEESALPAPLTAEAIGVLCDRHLGVGADGILLHGRPTGDVAGAVARMRVFNPDGGEPEMCGNGIRIFARFLARSGAAVEPEFIVETLAGPIKPRLLDDGTVRVDMGRARFISANIDWEWSGDGSVDSGLVGVSPGDDVVDATLEAGGRSYQFTFVDVGNPHCVIQVEDPATFDVAHVGPIIEHHPLFPNRVNVEFVRVEADGSVRMRVWERGVGETQACGTGATAVGAACVRLGLAATPVLVHLLGGDLTIEVADGARDDVGAHGSGGGGRGAYGGDRKWGPRIFMTGPAEEVFSCTLSGDLLRRLGWPAPPGN